MSSAERVYSQHKVDYFETLKENLDAYSKCFLVDADNVGSLQMQQIRASLRGKAVILMGKNTMIRKAMREHVVNNPKIESLIELMRGNTGMVFTNEDLIEVRDLLISNKRPAPARVNAIAPVDVFIPAGPTGQGPEKTSFFQALSIATKISRSMIEILREVHLIKKGDKVGASEAALLNMLGISPFAYSLSIKHVWDDGQVLAPAVLDITDDDVISKFAAGINNVASLSLEIGLPTRVSVPHSLINGFKNLLAIAAETEVTFKEAETVKAFLADPSAFASAAPAAADAKKDDAPAAAAASSSSSSMGGGFDMFG
jgi:large subunit ribosomal protein LP0